MKILKTYIIPVLTMIALIIAAVFWTEADREIKILCQVAESFENTAQLDRLIGTAENSRLFYEDEGTYSLKSHQNLRTSECIFMTRDTELISAEYLSYFSLPYSAAIINLFLFSFLLLLQLSLAGGLPFGKLAWGGKHKVLPKNYRIASLAAAFIYLILIFVLTEHLGKSNLIAESGFITEILWAIFGIFFLSSIANTFSKSTAERRLMLPVAVIITTCSFIIALNS
ncbi:hypothetical protein AB2B38_010835 [Balneola sp. MJW-20]|uniref:hypothetical protein n=1 Tax=Gracilimonas aurantiaca TaxID=3234185 RepID=UPI0034661753